MTQRTVEDRLRGVGIISLETAWIPRQPRWAIRPSGPVDVHLSPPNAMTCANADCLVVLFLRTTQQVSCGVKQHILECGTRLPNQQVRRGFE